MQLLTDQFLEAAAYGDCGTLRDLLSIGVDVHVKDDAALYWASRHCQTEAVRLLLDAGADVHADGNTMFWAMYFGRDEVIRALLDHPVCGMQIRDHRPVFDHHVQYEWFAWLAGMKHLAWAIDRRAILPRMTHAIYDRNVWKLVAGYLHVTRAARRCAN